MKKSMEMGLAVVMILVMGMSATRCDGARRTVLIDDFEFPRTWSTWAGDSDPKPTGKVEIAEGGRNGGQCGSFVYDVSCNNGYVSSDLNVAMPGEVEAIRFWAKAEGKVQTVVRVVDGSGQTHQQNLGVIAGNWQRIDLDTTQGWQHHFGGANDGVFHYPLKGLKIMRSKGSEPTVGTLLIDDIEVVTDVDKGDLEAVVAFPDFDFMADGVRVTSARSKAYGNYGYAIVLENQTAQEAALTVELEGCEDWFLQREKVRLGGGEQVTCALPIGYEDWNPYNRYPLTCRVMRGDMTVEQSKEIVGAKAGGVLLGQARHSREIKENVVGVNCHFAQGWDYRRYVPMVAEAGIKWIREDGVHFANLYQDPCTFEVNDDLRLDAESEAFVRSLNDHDVKLLQIVWRAAVKGKEHDPAAFYKYCEAFSRTLKRYGVDHFEIENEPHGWASRRWGGMWNGKEPSPWVKKYAAFVNAGAEGLKAGNPEATVIAAGGLITTCHHLLDEGLTEALDGLTDHPYSYSTIPELIPFGGERNLARDGIVTADDEHTFMSSMEILKDKMAGAGHDDMTIWLTEWGFSAYNYDGASPLSSDEDAAAPKVNKKGKFMYEGYTLRTQAKYMARRLLETIAADDVACSVIYDFRCDFNDPFHPEANFGLIENNYVRQRPAYYAVQRICGLFSDGVAVRDDLRIDVPLNREFTRQGSTWTRPYVSMPVYWEGKTRMEPLTVPRRYAFDCPNGELMVAVWMPIHAEDERQPDVCDITLGTAGYEHPIAIDLVTGERRDLKWKEDAEAKQTVLEGVWVPDYPIVIKLFPKR